MLGAKGSSFLTQHTQSQRYDFKRGAQNLGTLGSASTFKRRQNSPHGDRSKTSDQKAATSKSHKETKVGTLRCTPGQTGAFTDLIPEALCLVVPVNVDEVRRVHHDPDPSRIHQQHGLGVVGTIRDGQGRLMQGEVGRLGGLHNVGLELLQLRVKAQNNIDVDAKIYEDISAPEAASLHAAAQQK
jgi:hypothetical protein